MSFFLTNMRVTLKCWSVCPPWAKGRHGLAIKRQLLQQEAPCSCWDTHKKGPAMIQECTHTQVPTCAHKYKHTYPHTCWTAFCLCAPIHAHKCTSDNVHAHFKSLIPSLIFLQWQGPSSLDDTETLHPPEDVEPCAKVWHSTGRGSQPTPSWRGINHCRPHYLSAPPATVTVCLAAYVWVVC